MGARSVPTKRPGAPRPDGVRVLEAIRSLHRECPDDARRDCSTSPHIIGVLLSDMTKPGLVLIWTSPGSCLSVDLGRPFPALDQVPVGRQSTSVDSTHNARPRY